MSTPVVPSWLDFSKGALAMNAGGGLGTKV